MLCLLSSMPLSSAGLRELVRPTPCRYAAELRRAISVLRARGAIEVTATAKTPIASVLMNTGVLVRQKPRTTHASTITAKMPATVRWIA